MPTQEQRQLVITEAMTWIGTKYEDRQCLKGVAADCATFPLVPFQAAGFVPKNYVIPDHGFQWFMHKQADGTVDEKYIKELTVLGFAEIQETEVQMGDFVLFQFGVAYAHGAIVINWPHEVIHCFGKHSGVCLMDPTIDGLFYRKPKRYFSWAG